MNGAKYAKIYSEFHGCTSFTMHGGDYIILSFKDENWDTWLVSRLYQSHRIQVQVQLPLAQAFKVLFKTEAPVSAFCKQDSFSILLGNERMIFPMPDSTANIHLCATPFFVRDPQIVYDYLQGVARPSNNHIFSYNNAVVFLDSCDIPSPGGCYFNPTSTEDASPLYRICILSQEPIEHVIKLANTWKVRRGISHIPFQTRDTISHSKFIRFKPVQNVQCDSNTSLATNTIQKKLSIHRPQCLLHDIINSYYRHVLRFYEDSEADSNPRLHLQSLGLIVEWPFRIAYEGLHRAETEEKTFVALAVNGYRPNRVIFVNQPYERYVEYQDVPATIWIPISYIPTILETPVDVVKVSVDSTVIGYFVHGTFFCFSRAMLEGRPTHASQSNINYIFNVAKPSVFNDNRFTIIETFRYDEKHVLHHINFQGIETDAWCLCENLNDATIYPKYLQLPWLVHEWINFYAENHAQVSDYVNVGIVRLALVLAKHGICFQTKIVPPQRQLKKENEMIVTDSSIELCMSQEVADFINNVRLEVEDLDEGKEEKSFCNIM